MVEYTTYNNFVKTKNYAGQRKWLLKKFLTIKHDLFSALTIAGTVYFAEKDALKGSLPKTLRQVRPTRFLGVPRVYEKMHEKMLEIGSQQNFIARAIGSWAKRVTLQHHLDRMAGKPSNSLQYQIARKFVISKVKQALGFDRCLTLWVFFLCFKIDNQRS